jgi:hypothetical protein
MTSRFKRTAIGLLAFTTLSVVIGCFTYLEILVPAPVTHLLSQTHNPAASLVLFSIFMACAIRVLISVGIRLPILKEIIDHKQDENWRNLLGMPLNLVFVIGILSAGGLALQWPRCTSPVITFTVRSGSQTYLLDPGGLLKAAPGSTLTLTASAQNENMLKCSWSFLGKPILDISPKSACTVQIDFSREPGPGVVNLAATQGFCRQVVNAPLEVTLEE